MPYVPRSNRRTRKRRSSPPYRKRRNARVSKKTMVKSRAPLVETKSKESVLTNYPLRANGFAVFPCETYNLMANGYEEDEIIGRDYFSKYLTQKFQIEMAGLSTWATPSTHEFRFVSGLCCPFNNQTTPTNVDNQDFYDFVTAQLDLQFGSGLGFCNFQEKVQGLRILKNYRIKPATNGLRSAENGAGVDTGFANTPDKNISHTIKPMKKVMLNRATDGTLYNDRQWIPFSAIQWNIITGSQGSGEFAPRITHVEKHWFTDS